MQLDTAKLNRYLEARLDGFKGLQQASKFGDGQSNPSFLLHASSGEYVLRMQPLGELLKSAHAVDREFRVIGALQHSEVPVAQALHFCDDRDVLGSLFYIMSYEAGRIFWDPALPDLSRPERSNIYDEMNRVLAALHDIDIDAVGLADYGKPGNYFERQVGRWSKQYRASETSLIPAMEKLIDWLPQNLPADDARVSLIHGDYRIDNIIFESNACRARALLDWELSTLGHPFADLAYQCMQWRLPQDAVIAGLGDSDRGKLGIPDEAEYVARYCQRRGLSAIANWNFYLVFSFFRFAAILQGVLKRALDGNASSEKAFAYGALAPILCDQAIDILDRG